MTRIAGRVVARGEGGRSEELAGAMAGRMQARASQPVRTAALPLGALACLGSDDGGFHREPDGLTVVFDGRVYNAAELGVAPGREARAAATLYRKLGFAEAVARLNGDFALALFDPATGELWLARDRIGARPLYYTRRGDALSFASRCKALLGLPGVSSEPSPQFVALVAAGHYRSFDNEPAKSPYRDIEQLPAAHWLRFRNGSVGTGSYWSLREQPEWEKDEATLAEEYRALLLDAVAIRLARAPDPAFTLSGGMDSSSVLSCAVATSGEKQTAYSTVYEDRTYDESDEIRTILDRTVASWRPVHVDDPDVFGLIDEMVAVHDEPVATATWLSHYLLCRQAAGDGTGTLFGGLGGDELNAGEYEHFFFRFADLKFRGEEKQLAHEVEKWVEYHDHPIFRKSFASMLDVLSRVADPQHEGRCLPDRARTDRYAGLLHPEFFDLTRFEPVMDHPFSSYLNNRTYQDIFRETSPCCLRAQDRQGAAFGLDHCLPFFDHRVVEFMFRVPGRMKIRDGVTKVLLREAMRGVVPDETRTRIKKTGWNAPAHIWFGGKRLDAIRERVSDPSFAERRIYDVPALLRLIDEHERIVTSGAIEENHMMLLWQLVNLESWLRSLERA